MHLPGLAGPLDLNAVHPLGLLRRLHEVSIRPILILSWGWRGRGGVLVGDGPDVRDHQPVRLRLLGCRQS